MEKQNTKEKCAHIPCQCEPETGGRYCSLQCKEAVNETDCRCGHLECRAEA